MKVGLFPLDVFADNYADVYTYNIALTVTACEARLRQL